MKRLLTVVVAIVLLFPALAVMLPPTPALAAVEIDRDRIKQVIYPTFGYPAIIKGGEELTIEFDPRNQDWSKGLMEMTDFEVSATTTNSVFPVTRALPLEHFSVGYSTHWPEYSQASEPRARLYRVTVDVPETLPVHLYDLTVKGRKADGSWLTDSQPHALQAVDEFKTDFKYAQLTDIHVYGREVNYPTSYHHERGYRHEAYSETDGYGAPYYHKAVQQMNRANPDFLVYSGDYDYSQQWLYKQNYADFDAYKNSPWNGKYYEPWFEMDWFYQETLKLNVPVFMVLGNHDGYCRYDLFNLNLEEDYMASWRDLFGPQYYSFDYGPDYHFSAVDSMDWSTKDRNLHWLIPDLVLRPGKWQGQVGSGGDAFQAGWSQAREDAINENNFTGQLLWLKNDLEAHGSSAMKTIILHHDPWKLGGSGSQYDDASFLGIKFGGKGAGRLSVIKLAREHNVSLVLSGHDHSDSYGSIPWKAGGGEVKFANTTSTQFPDGSGTDMWPYPGHRYIRVVGDQVANFYYLLADDESGNPLQWSWPSYAGTTVGGPNNYENLTTPSIESAWSGQPGGGESLDCTVTNHHSGYQFIPGGEWSGDLNGAGMEFAMPRLSDGYYYEAANGEFGDIFDSDVGNYRTYEMTTDVEHAADGDNPTVKTVALAKSATPDTQAPTCATFEIDGGAPTTQDVLVTLTNDAVDPGGSGLMDMKIWNDGQSEDDAVWQRYETEVGWELRHLAGTRTVYTRFRDRAMPGNVSEIYQASIGLVGAAPTIDSVSPDHARVGDEVEIDGANFGEPRTEEDKVRFNGVQADVTSWTDTRITCTVPHGVCTGMLTVSTDAGSVGTEFHVVPSIDSVTPDYGYNDRVTHVSNLAGTGFYGVEGPPTVKLWSGATQVFASNVDVVSPQQITCDFDLAGVPVGFYSITVQNNDGYGDALAGGFRVDYPPPEIDGITPASGVNTGPVDITDLAGGYFRDGMRAFLISDGAEIEATDVVLVSSSRATCTFDLAGAAPGARDVQVINPDGKAATLQDGFEVLNPAPRLDGIDPSRALVGSPDTTVNVTGADFLASSVVRWNGSDRATTFIDASNLQVVIPAADLSAPGAFPVTVFNPAPGGGTSSAIDFDVFYNAPTIASVSPTSATRGRTVKMTVKGSDFRGPDGNILVSTGPGGAWTGTVKSWTALEVVCEIPIPANGRTGTYDVSLQHRDDGKKATLDEAFTVTYQPPAVVSVTPESAPVGRSRELAVKGRDFRRGATVKLRRGGLEIKGSAYDYSGLPGRFTAMLDFGGAATPGRYDLVVENPDGKTSTLAGAFTVTGAGQSKWYLAEGSTAWGFDTYVSVLNPNPRPVDVIITWIDSGGRAARQAFETTLPAESQATVNARDHVGDKDVSAVVESRNGETIAVDRTMTWNGPEAHASVGVTAPRTTWYFAEDSTLLGFETWVLVQNPGDTEANVEIKYMTENGGPRIARKAVPANSRRTYSMAADAGEADASIQVSSDVPVIAERAVYRNNRREGHETVGEYRLSSDYYLAEGTTAWGFDTYLLVVNAHDSAMDVSVFYQTPAGEVASEPFRMPANSRKTIKVNDVPGVRGTDCSIRVHGSKPLMAERAMYWDSGRGEACHCSIGTPAPSDTWYFADGACGNGWETWTLIQNTNDRAVRAEIRYLAKAGGPDANTVKTVTVPARSRVSVDMAATASWSSGGGTAITSLTESGGGKLKLIVERSMYKDGRRVGTDTIGGYPVSD